ncbi:MAG: GNAT family N-acetyltransferase [Coprococcus sp.]|nr:GNAT family N-acetyltransferase [Coprococcus sp.]
MISVKRYNSNVAEDWNGFNRHSKNYMFMFDRNYMDYHNDRFTDHSLMLYDDGRLVALIPMSEHGAVLISHGGLTYGGFITDEKMKQHTMNACFEELISYARENGFMKIIYKCIPHIYHNQPAEEDRFALFANGATLVTVDVSTYVNLDNPLKMPKGRKAQVSRAKREGAVIAELTETHDYNRFIKLENEILCSRHNVKAVHTGDELKLLHDRFPDNIHLFAAKKDNEIIAGTVVYEYDQVVHTQYMAANDEARVIGALDLTIATVIEKYRGSKKWLDFGISTEHGRLFLNEGLCSQKEGFGGRTGVYEIWELNV